MKIQKQHSTSSNLHKKSTAKQSNTPFFQKQDKNGLYPKTPEIREPFFKPNTYLQYKLNIGSPNDKYEKEADSVADNVVNKLNKNTATPSPLTQATNSPKIQQKKDQKDKLDKKEEEKSKADTSIALKPIFGASDEDESIQRKAHNETTTASPDLQNRLDSTKGSGQSMPSDVQANMGNAIGSDFSKVKIHTDSQAVQMSQDLGAQAFTHGADIYFNEGKYDTKSDSGKHLLAHELTHTVQQGAAIQKKAMISKTSEDSEQGGIRGMISSKLNGLAEQFIPGYSLLNVILGRNLITGASVERSGVNIIKGYMELLPIIGSILFNELKETQSLQEAGTWVEGKMEELGIDFNLISLKLEAAWEEMSIWKGIDGNLAVFKKHLGGTIGQIRSMSAIVEQKVKVLRIEAALRLVGAHQLLDAIRQDPEAMQKLVEDPKTILKYFMQALQQGFQGFKKNFGKHFKAALFGWLFGKTAQMGIEMPKQMNIAGLFGLMAQLLGLTYAQVRAQVVEKLGPKGESIVARLEQTAEIVIDFMTKGPIALWERVKESLTNLKEMVFAKITEFVSTQLIQAVVTKLVSMLNPAGAIVQLALTIYKVVKYFIDWWDRIKEIASGVLSSITKVVTGAISMAANFLENIFAKGMTVFIGFLANILGLGGLANKVIALIKKISKPIKDAIDKVVTWIVEKGKALAAKLFSKKGDAKKIKDANKNAKDVKVTEKDKQKHKEIGQAIKKKISEQSDDEASFATVYSEKKVIAKQLENQYQPMLSKGINLDIKFQPIANDKKDGDIDITVVIAPNDYRNKFEISQNPKNNFNFNKAVNNKIKNLGKKTKNQFFKDFKTKNQQVLSKFNTYPRLIDAWKTIAYSRNNAVITLRTNTLWLSRIRDWINAKVEITAAGNFVRLKNRRKEIGRIKNEILLSTNYRRGFKGKGIGEVVNGCQVFKKGTLLYVKRVSDTAPFTPNEVAVLKAHPNAHALEKHSFDVTDEALKFRASKGIAPNGQHVGRGGPPYPTQDGSKFNSADDVKAALSKLGPSTTKYKNALHEAISEGKRSFAIVHIFNTSIGYGYKKNTLEPVAEIKKVLAAYKRDNSTGKYYLVTMYPKID